MYKTSLYTLVNGDMQWLTHRKQQKSYHSPSHRLTVNVLLNNITLFWFLLFSMCQSLHVAVKPTFIFAVLCWWSIINQLLSTAMKTLNLIYFGVTILTFRGHVTSSVTWPLDSAYVVSYWRSIVTMHLSCTVTEIWGPKDIGVTTFWGHVTSSVTWPSDSA